MATVTPAGCVPCPVLGCTPRSRNGNENTMFNIAFPNNCKLYIDIEFPFPLLVASAGLAGGGSREIGIEFPFPFLVASAGLWPGLPGKENGQSSG